MHFPRLVSTVVLVLVASACSDEDDSSTTTTTNPNQAAGSGGGGNASGSAAGSGGSAGSASLPAGNGGSASEAPANPTLNQGGSTGASPGGASAGAAGTGAMPPPPPVQVGDAGAADASMSFFQTSRGGPNGGNFGGLAGADAFCETLAAAANPALAAKTWRAYLSTTTENARDRIGAGPWRNAAGVIIANNVADLHDQAAGGASEANYPLNDANAALREDGTPLPAQPVTHDVLTGSNLDGTLSASGTCSDWTAITGTTRNGHSNRAGGGQNPSSWNSAHDTGCAPAVAGQNFQMGTVTQGGGIGAIYCFAAD
jgi:hypothetical protein